MSLLALATAVLYFRAGGFPFIDNYDDSLYVTNNPHVRGGLSLEGIRWALTGVCAGNWHPLTMLSHMADCTLFGVSPGGPHLVNVALHVANALLLFWVLYLGTRDVGPSAFVAGLFALHPLRVESVAWIAERKDVLSTLFLLLTVWAYFSFVRTRRARDYARVAAAFACGLMAKPMLVTLPLLLVLLDAWPLGRIAWSRAPAGPAGRITLAQSLKEKLPLLGLTVISIGLTLYAQHEQGATAGTTLLPLGARVGNAIVSYVAYIGKMFVPTRLAFFYPHPVHIPIATTVGALAVLLAATATLLALRRTVPYAFIGWLWYLVALVPVIGVIQVGSQEMADRYTYVPQMGLAMALAWTLRDLVARTRMPAWAPWTGAAAILLALALVTSRQLEYWRSPAALFRHGIEATNGNFIAHGNYAVELLAAGKPDEAAAHFRKAVEINPSQSNAWCNLGIVLRQQQKFDEAAEALAGGLRAAPGDPRLRYNLGLVRSLQGRYPEAFDEFEAALRAAPESPETRISYSRALSNHGAKLGQEGRYAEAIKYFEHAARVDPSNADVAGNLELTRRLMAGARVTGR